MARMDEGQIVLETDAHYLSPSNDCLIGSPLYLLSVTREVAKIRNVPVSMLIERVNWNAMKVYEN